MRIKFSKTDGARFISHLDLMRTATRALKRANVPVYYTQGFNPHPYLVFSPPLSLGVISRCELLDIRLENPLLPEELQKMLDGAFPAGINVLDVYEQEHSFNEITYARYKLTFSETLTDKFNEFISQPQITVERRAKKGRIVQVDLKAEVEIENIKKGKIDFILPCGNEKNISVNLFSEAFRLFAKAGDMPVLVERLDFLDKDKNIFK